MILPSIIHYFSDFLRDAALMPHEDRGRFFAVLGVVCAVSALPVWVGLQRLRPAPTPEMSKVEFARKDQSRVPHTIGNRVVYWDVDVSERENHVAIAAERSR